MPNGITKAYDGRVGVEWYDDEIRVKMEWDTLTLCREDAMDFARAVVQAVDESERAAKSKLSQLGPGAVIKWPITITFHRDYDDKDSWITSRGDFYTAEYMLGTYGNDYAVLYKGLDT